MSTWPSSTGSMHARACVPRNQSTHVPKVDQSQPNSTTVDHQAAQSQLAVIESYWGARTRSVSVTAASLEDTNRVVGGGRVEAAMARLYFAAEVDRVGHTYA